jgi:hypothetical protein
MLRTELAAESKIARVKGEYVASVEGADSESRDTLHDEQVAGYEPAMLRYTTRNTRCRELDWASAQQDDVRSEKIRLRNPIPTPSALLTHTVYCVRGLGIHALHGNYRDTPKGWICLTTRANSTSLRHSPVHLFVAVDDPAWPPGSTRPGGDSNIIWRD